MMDKRPKPQGEKPEPEIIPPEHPGRQTAQDTPRMRIFVDTHGTEHFYVARLRPLGIILVVLSAFLIWIPVVVLLVIAATITGLLRGYFERTS